MLKPYDTPPSSDEPENDSAPECRSTLDRIQRVLDGDAGADALESLSADPHPASCPACRERVRAARVLLSVLAMPGGPRAVSPGFADRVVTALQAERAEQAERRSGSRRRASVAAAWLALAAAVLVAVYVAVSPPWRKSPSVQPGEIVQNPTQPEHKPEPREVAPLPHAKKADPPVALAPAPHPRPIRIGDEVARAGQTLLQSPMPLTESVAVAPKLLDVLTESFKFPAPPADPMGAALEPARKSLAELPLAARHGLEPVTGTAEKAFNRFLRDVGAVKPNS